MRKHFWSENSPKSHPFLKIGFENVPFKKVFFTAMKNGRHENLCSLLLYLPKHKKASKTTAKS